MPHFVYLSVVGGHLDCFYLLAVVNNATIGFVYKVFCRENVYGVFVFLSLDFTYKCNYWVRWFMFKPFF